MLHTVINLTETVARDLESAIKKERAALAAVDAADGTREFAMREVELKRCSSAVAEFAHRLLACPALGLPDILRKVRLLSAIHPDGEGVAFVGGEEIGGVEPYDGVGLDIRAVDAIMRDLQRLAAR
ncbi:MAG TPA: hypothetical protein P5340_11590 [Defluviicoccus sp.]|nr:hypothetical protein [Methylobacteriaceae bacterium]HRW61282.1 hypothetical protein [Defluviicoccus sp.]